MESIPDSEQLYCPDRESLDAYCARNYCPKSLAELSAAFNCSGADEDAGFASTERAAIVLACAGC